MLAEHKLVSETAQGARPVSNTGKGRGPVVYWVYCGSIIV